MNLVITCGPAWEPLDGMRRLTNASSGRLGSVLADAFAAAGHRVTVFRGDMATAPLPLSVTDIHPFGTNDQLASVLSAFHGRLETDAVFHAAALCDFKLGGVRSEAGAPVTARKLPTRSGRLTLELEPATKVLPGLRGWFPKARIVGWKYELDGVRDAALSAAWRQLREAGTDACVLNGDAWGPGFALCEAPSSVIPCPDTDGLTQVLLAWVGRATVKPA